VIENGVDLDRFLPADEPRKEGDGDLGFHSSGARLLFVGHNFRLKGLPSALRVLGRLLRSPVEASLVVVGRGHEKPYRALARRLGVESRVSFRGACDRVERYYQAADVLLHPTYYDPCSLVVLEAMASGLPVVTTRWNGASEQLLDLPGALVVEDPHRIDEMARGIADLVSHRDLHREARLAVRARAERHPWQEKLRAMEDVLLQGREGS
jgi:UDP-glucose:(heptosyl)LPS alpha-1,3-glucosyltransferase